MRMVRSLAAAASALAIAAAAAQGAERVAFGVGAAPGASVYIQVDIAKALGYFQQEEVEAQFQHFKGGAVPGWPWWGAQPRCRPTPRTTW